MSTKLNYSTAAHLIHSRIQLIRHRLSITEHMQIPMIVYKHKEYFDKAAASVLATHNVESKYIDMCDAAELLYRTFYPPPGKNDVPYKVVQFMDSRINQWIDIKWWDEENGITLADPEERLDHYQALERLNSMKVGRLIIFRIFTKYDIAR